MSLINDALKRANQTKPPVAPDPSAQPLRIVDPPPEPAGPPKWLLFVFPAALLLVCGIAGLLIFQGWQGSDESTPQLGAVTASARVSDPEPTPVHPSNDWVSVPPVAVPPTNTASTTSVASSSTESSFPELRLQGVFYRPSNPSAVINAKTVYKGDKVDTARVIAIGKETVTVEWKGQRKVLTME